MPIDKTKFKPAPEPEGVLKTAHRVWNTPAIDLIPGGKKFKENLTDVTSNDADQQYAQEEIRKSTPTASRADQSTLEKVGKMVRENTPFGLGDLLVDSAKIPFSTARQKGFIRGVVDALTPNQIAQIAATAASGGGGAAAKAAIALNSAVAGNDFYNASDSSKSGTERLISGVGGAAGLLGVGHGVLSQMGKAGTAAEDVAGAAKAAAKAGSKTGPGAAMEAYQRIKADLPPGAPGRRALDEILADHQIVDADTLKNPGSRVALRVFDKDKGRANVKGGVETPLSDVEYEEVARPGTEMAIKNNEAAAVAKQKKMDSDAATNALVLEAQEKAAKDAEKAAAKKADDLTKLTIKQDKVVDKNIKDTSKEFGQAVKQKNSNLNEIEAAEKEAIRKQEIENFKNKEGVESQGKTLTESSSAVDEAGRKKNLTEKFREAADDEDGPGSTGGDGGGAGGTKNHFFTFREAKESVANRGGDAATHNIIKRSKGHFEVVDRPPAGEGPETPGGVIEPAPEGGPKGPLGGGNPADLGPKRDQFHNEIWPNRAAAQAIADKYSLAVRQAGPRGRWETYKPESMSPEVSTPRPPEGLDVAGGVPVDSGPEGPSGPRDYPSLRGSDAGKPRTNFSPEPLETSANKYPGVSMDKLRRWRDLTPVINGPKLTPAEWEEYTALGKEIDTAEKAGKAAKAVKATTPEAPAEAPPVFEPPAHLDEAGAARYKQLADKFTKEGTLTPEEIAEVTKLETSPEEVAPHVNPVGEAEPVLPGVNPVVNPPAKPVAEVPFGLTPPPSARLAKAKESVNPLFEAQMDDLHPDVEDIGAARASEKILPTGNGTLPAEGPLPTEAAPATPAEPELPAMAEQPGPDPQDIVEQIRAGLPKGSKKPSGPMGKFAQQLGKQKEGAAPLETPEGLVPPVELEGDTAINQIPKNRLLEIAQNKETPTKGALNGVAPARTQAQAPERPAITKVEAPTGEPAVQAPVQGPEAEAPIRVAPDKAPSPTEGAGTVPVEEPELSLEDIAKLPEDQQEPALLAQVKKFLSSQKGGGGMSGQGGYTNPAMMGRMAMGALGGTAGAYYDPAGNKPLSFAGGAALAAFAPEIYRGLEGAYTQAALKGAGPVESGLDVANKLHNTGLLSPLSVVKKFAGDLGGMSLAALEHPDRAGDLARQFLSKDSWKNNATNFVEGFNGPEAEQVKNGVENFFQNKLVGSQGRLMGGLTKATKGAMGESGFSVPEQAYYTMTADPKYAITKSLYAMLNGSKMMQHLSPFSRIGINRLERGWEYSPLGLINMVGKTGDKAALKDVFRKAAIGSTVGGAVYAATPENFVQEHPIAASTMAALAGPLGIPVIASMAMKTNKKEVDEDNIEFSKKLARASAAIGRDIPGLRLMEDLTGRGFPEGFGRNYLAGYTNITRPAALLENKIRGNGEADVSSLDLPGYQKYVNRAISNVPLLQQVLPRKDEEGDMSDPFSAGTIYDPSLDPIKK